MRKIPMPGDCKIHKTKANGIYVTILMPDDVNAVIPKYCEWRVVGRDFKSKIEAQKFVDKVGNLVKQNKWNEIS